jgi:hypothetical protein
VIKPLPKAPASNQINVLRGSFARSLRMTRRISSSTGGSTITYQLSLRIEYVKSVGLFVATSRTYLSGVQMEYLNNAQSFEEGC